MFVFRILFITVVIEFFLISTLIVFRLRLGRVFTGLILLVIRTSVVCLFLRMISSILRTGSSEILFI